MHSTTSPDHFIHSEATAGFEPADKGFADLCLTTWLRRQTQKTSEHKYGAEDGIRPATLCLASRLLYH